MRLNVLLRVIPQVGAQPAFDVTAWHSFAVGVALYLVAEDHVHGKVARLRVAEIPAAHRRRRVHGTALGQTDGSSRIQIEQLPDRPLGRVVRAGGIARRGTDA